MADAGITLTDYSHTERATHNGSFCSPTKCSTVIFAVIAAVAIVFVILGSIHLFGAVGSVGFIAALATGGAVAALMIGALICSALSYYKKQKEEGGVPLFIPKETTTNPPLKGNSTVDVTFVGTSTSPITGNSVESNKTKEKEKAQQMGLIKSLPLRLPECECALAFAREELKKRPDIEPIDMSNFTPPVNQDILRLWPLYLGYRNQLLKLIVQEKDHNPWSQNQVIKLADACIKLSYALGCMMLEDLPAFTKKLEEHGIKSTYIQTLAKQSYYQHLVFYFCPLSYSHARGGVIFTEKADEDGRMEITGENYSNGKKQEYQDLFYKPGTKQNEWNRIYNHYCQSVECFVSEEDLKNRIGSYEERDKRDERLYAWSREDRDRTFEVNPCEIPT